MSSTNTTKGSGRKAKNAVMDQVRQYASPGIVRSMPWYYTLSFGLVTEIITFGVFIYILVRGYQVEVTQQYLTPTGTGDSRYCSKKLVSNTGDFLVTQDGSWSGTSGFSYSSAIYKTSVQNLQLSNSDFKTEYTTYFDAIDTYGNTTALTKDLAGNLLEWMSAAYISTDYSYNRFYMNGNPRIVFDREYVAGSLTSQHHDCLNIGYASYDSVTGTVRLSFEYYYYSLYLCNHIVNPVNIGYYAATNPFTIDFKYDIETVITAVAVNTQVFALSSLSAVVGTTTNFTAVSSNGTNATLQSAYYVDPRYSSMQPLRCVSSYEKCYIDLGATVAIPIFQHVGKALDSPQPCNCSTMTDAEKADEYNLCNQFIFMLGFLFYITTKSAPLDALLYKYSYDEIQTKSFYPMFAGSLFGTNADDYYYTGEPYKAERADYYEFCTIPGYGSCNFLVFSFFDYYKYDWSVSPYRYQLKNGACQNSFSISDTAKENAVTVPFAPLQEGYDICNNSPLQSVLDNLGIASGYLQLLIPIVAVLVLLFIRCLEFIGRGPFPRTFSQEEKDDILNRFATALLMEKYLKSNKILDKHRLIVDQFAAKKLLHTVLKDIHRMEEDIRTIPEMEFPIHKRLAMEELEVELSEGKPAIAVLRKPASTNNDDDNEAGEEDDEESGGYNSTVLVLRGKDGNYHEAQTAHYHQEEVVAKYNFFAIPFCG